MNLNWFKPPKPVPAPPVSVPLERQAMLWPIEAICLHPQFTIENANEDPTLVKVFYEVGIRLTSELSIPADNFAYYRDNFVPNELRACVQNKDELIDYLGWELLKPRRHDSRYMMGFRSWCFILRENIHLLDALYLSDIHKQLTPFYKVYKHPHYLVWGCPL